MLFLLDHYDSFVYNLSACVQEMGQEILVKRPEEMNIDMLEAIQPQGIILSPGPGHPSHSKFSSHIIDKYAGKIPILGVCLGHQIIGHYFGGDIVHGTKPMHGKVTEISLAEHELFADLPKTLLVTRYHSLVLCRESMPEQLLVTAQAEEGTVMGISHKELPVYGVQFHPEAVLTEQGHVIMKNFIEICRRWRSSNEKN